MCVSLENIKLQPTEPFEKSIREKVITNDTLKGTIVLSIQKTKNICHALTVLAEERVSH